LRSIAAARASASSSSVISTQLFPGANYRREGDIVHGSGVADMKGGDVVLIHALHALKDAGVLAETQIIVVMTGTRRLRANQST